MDFSIQDFELKPLEFDQEIGNLYKRLEKRCFWPSLWYQIPQQLRSLTLK